VAVHSPKTLFVQGRFEPFKMHAGVQYMRLEIRLVAILEGNIGRVRLKPSLDICSHLYKRTTDLSVKGRGVHGLVVINS
jgi:hypothetical protein